MDDRAWAAPAGASSTHPCQPARPENPPSDATRYGDRVRPSVERQRQEWFFVTDARTQTLPPRREKRGKRERAAVRARAGSGSQRHNGVGADDDGNSPVLR